MRLAPAPLMPLAWEKTPAVRPRSPEFLIASCSLERLHPCTLPSAIPTLPCFECILSIQPGDAAADGVDGLSEVALNAQQDGLDRAGVAIAFGKLADEAVYPFG